MKFKKGKKVLSLVLAALMVLSVMPTSMLIQKANAATAFEGGKEVADGTWKGWTWSVFGGYRTKRDDGLIPFNKRSVIIM